MIKRSRFNEIVQSVSHDTGVGLSDTSKVLKEYLRLLADDLGSLAPDQDPVLYGVLKLDPIVLFHPGITVVYSADDVGKTAVLKTMAMNLSKQGKVVLYIDAENKLYLHQMVPGVNFTSTKHMDAAMSLINTGLVDVLLVDTISSMPHNTLKAFMFTVKKKVPFIILAAQMRVDIEARRKVPACSDSILSSAHTHIYLTESEKISFERLDMRRVQFSIMKYEADVHLARQRSSFVISEGIVSNFWSAVDHLHSTGMIRAKGQHKYLDGRLVGKYTDIISDEQMVHLMITSAWSCLSDKEVDVGIFCEPRELLLKVQTAEYEGEQDDISPGEEELSAVDCS